MNDDEYQLRHLQEIYDNGLRSPFLKRNRLKANPKYDGLQGPFRISYDDVMAFKFVVRRDPSFSDNGFWSESTEVIAEYDSIQALVADGWRLD